MMSNHVEHTDLDSIDEANKKYTICSSCHRTFWYLDPRTGGRPRQKCGECSARPPRYAWGFVDEEPEEESLPEELSTTTSSTQAYIDKTKGPVFSSNNPQAVLFRDVTDNPLTLQRLHDQVELLHQRIEVLEDMIGQMKAQMSTRSDWIDLSARLDIVEQNTNKTLHKVRSHLDGFTREVRQIAVIPERELHEMFDLVRLIKHYLGSENGNQ